MRQIGNFSLQTIVESQEPFADPFEFFPDATQDVLDANASWLNPHYVDAQTGRLIFCFQSYIVRTEHHTILVDSCIGNDKERPTRPNWHMRKGPFLGDLAALGLQPDDIDVVLCTHLHADHVGWNTQLVDGRWVPTFPNAKYVMARDEYRFWEGRFRDDPSGVRSVSFGDSVLPVMEAKQAVLVDMDHEIEDGVWLDPAPGHTPGSVIVNLRSGDATAALLGDTIHHPVQLARPDWSSFACEDQALSATTRRALIERFADTDTLMAPAHFAAPTVGHIISAGDAFGYRLSE